MGKIRVEGLKKSYGANQVLKGIDMQVQEGEVVCLIGPSGSGKSTFLRCINRLEEITAGRVIVVITSYSIHYTKLYEAIPLLLGLGLHEFSMSASSVLPARELLSRLSRQEWSRLAAEALNMSSQQEVLDFVNNQLRSEA